MLKLPYILSVKTKGTPTLYSVLPALSFPHLYINDQKSYKKKKKFRHQKEKYHHSKLKGDYKDLINPILQLIKNNLKYPKICT